MPTTTNVKGGYTSNISNSGSSSLSLPSSSQSHLSMSAQPDSLALSPTVWESTTESPNDSESLPPRIRPKNKRKPFSEFRIIREPTSIQDHTTELKPIPSPPWANDSYSLDSSQRLHNDTRGKGTGGPPFRKESCTYGRKSSAERSAQAVPDEDDDDIVVASAVLKQLQHSGTEANTFPPPARPSRKQKRYTCDVCGQIFTRSGDVRRHKESRHDNSEGCRCPFCDRVLTRQDALQRHWDKYCRKKSKRHLDKQVDETQTRTISSLPTPAAPPQTTSIITTSMEIGTGLDQSQINYRYLNIFG